MPWDVPLHSQNFLPSMQAALPGSFVVDDADLLWGAITVGRHSLQHVFAFGRYSFDEALFRWAMVSANVMRTRNVTGLHNSPAFDALDPTEKGWVNYSLGMIFTKICAEKLLNTPWLMHFKWFAASHAVQALPGGSTPDFVGFDVINGAWHVLEAKGRNSGFSNAILNRAKAQAQQAISVGGQICSLHVGTLLYRAAGRLMFAWADPIPDELPRLEIDDTHETWREYYRTAWGLYTLDQESKDRLAVVTGWHFDLDQTAAVYIGRLVEGVDDWKEARDGLIEWAANGGFMLRKLSEPESGRRVFGDGIVLTWTGRERPEWTGDR